MGVMSMCRQSGFTLVELLVVIAILAVLAALLFPVFTTARHASKASVCASNLRQLSKASPALHAGLRRVLPVGFLSKWGVANGVMSAHTVGCCCIPTCATTASRCALPTCRPIDLTAMRTVRKASDLSALCRMSLTQASLMPNWCLMVNAATYPEVPPVSLARLPFPASTGFWFDGWLGVSHSGAGFEPMSGVDPRHSLSARVPDRVLQGQESRYRGKGQASFVDGHVRAFHTRLEPDARRRGDVAHYTARPITIDNRLMPRWFIQGGVYHERQSFFGWPSRPKEGNPNRMLLMCYPRPNLCEEWD
jgi:prepilin-type N-terminal cleavage/methylation domain-containing protein/prepilin-type processing-associated H-X9-DG protein